MLAKSAPIGQFADAVRICVWLRGKKEAPENRSLLPLHIYARAVCSSALGLAMRVGRLAHQALKRLKGLPGKPVVEFADPL